MGKETVEQGFDRIYDSMDFTEFCFPSFKLGVKWEQEQNGLTIKEGIDFGKELSNGVTIRVIQLMLRFWLMRYSRIYSNNLISSI